MHNIVTSLKNCLPKIRSIIVTKYYVVTYTNHERTTHDYESIYIIGATKPIKHSGANLVSFGGLRHDF
jgi:hypothetical protein